MAKLALVFANDCSPGPRPHQAFEFAKVAQKGYATALHGALLHHAGLQWWEGEVEMMTLRQMLAFVGAMFVYSSVVTAAPYDDGMNAYREKNYVKAFPLLLGEAEAGNSKAQYAVGRMYEAGFGTQQDYANAAKWYRSAAEQGDPLAQHALSAMYAVGWGVSADQKEAVAWLRRSAKQGYYFSQNDLASRYANGRGVPKDDVKSYMWFDLAASSAPTTVADVMIKVREGLATKMTQDQVARAKEMATKCRLSNFAECD